jgi:uncharacterized Zn finger protein
MYEISRSDRWGAGQPLAELLTRRIARELADPVIVERGADYVVTGRVSDLEVDDQRATATVAGSEPYRVTLERGEGALLADCTCPMGREQASCKHLVAVAMEVAGAAHPPPYVVDAPVEDRHGGVDEADVATWLSRQPREHLEELLIAQLRRDGDFRRRLQLAVAGDLDRDLDLDHYRTVVDAAVSVDAYGGFVDWNDGFDWAEGLHATLGALRELLDAGHAEAVVELTERLHRRLEDVSDAVDDSAGILATVAGDLGRLHAAACQHARPEPRALARRLLSYQLEDELLTFKGVPNDYLDALGEMGLAAYVEEVEARWRQLPALAPGDEPARDPARSRLESMLREVAEAEEDVDRLIEVLAHDRSHGGRYLELIETCVQAERPSQALAFAREGQTHVPDDPRIAERLVGLLWERGQREEALSVQLEIFRRAPYLPAYRRLQELAGEIDRREQWRAAAMEVIAAHEAAEAEQRHDPPAGPGTRVGGRRGAQRSDRSLRVSILLWEGDIEEAWRHAVVGGCGEGQWEVLAHRRAVSHPADARWVYEGQLDAALMPASDGAYERVVDLLQRLRPLYLALDEPAAFDELVADIRRRHGRRRKLLERLDSAGFDGGPASPPG